MRGIHRVPDVLVDPGRDQPLPLLHIGIRGEICTEVGMGSPEQDEDGTKDAGPDPAGRIRESIIAQDKVRSEDIDPREDEHREDGQIDKPGIQYSPPVLLFYLSPILLGILETDGSSKEKTGDVEGQEDRRGHSRRTTPGNQHSVLLAYLLLSERDRSRTQEVSGDQLSLLSNDHTQKRETSYPGSSLHNGSRSMIAPPNRFSYVFVRHMNLWK